MKIIVSENQFKQIVGVEGVPSETLLEQVAVASEENTLTIVQQKINELLSDPKKEKALLDSIDLKLTWNGKSFILHIGDNKYEMKRTAKGMYAVIIPAGKTFGSTEIPTSAIAAEIEKIPEYKALVEKHPEIQKQIQGGKVRGQLYTSKSQQGFVKLTVVAELEDRKEAKMAVDVTKGYPLGEFFDRNKIIYKFPGGQYGIMESGDLMTDVEGINISLNPPPEQSQRQGRPINVKAMALADVFAFGEVEFKDEGKVNQRLQSFVQELKQHIESYGTSFIEYLKNQDPTIYGYTSRDGDPNQEIVGEYKPCSGNNLRKDYNLCLSNERVKKIAELLNQALPELDGAFQFKGMGETTHWGPGWTPENPTMPEQTAPNRRYVLKKFKPFTPQLT